MKRAKSRFAARKFEEGGLFGPDFLKKGFSKVSSPLGMASGAVNSLIGGLGPKPPAMDDLHDEEYQRQFAKSQETSNTIGGIGSAIASIPTPLTMVAGTVINGISKLFGGGDDIRKAEEDARRRKWSRDIAITDAQGARNINSMPRFTAPQYGGPTHARRGLKLGRPSGLKSGLRFKTKFSSPC